MPNNKIIFDAIVTEKAIFLTRNFLKPKLINFSEINVLIKKKKNIYIYIYTHGMQIKGVTGSMWKSSSLLTLYHFMAMAPHSSTLAWKIPWMEEPDKLQSMGSLRVGHDWATSLSLFTFMCWRRKWQPTPVFLPGESQGRGTLVGCHLWGCTELETTEVT